MLFITRDRINFFIVNLITFLRIVFSIYFSFLIFSGNLNLIILLSSFVLIGFSDFFDGRLARKFGVESKFGSIFDVFCDFFFVFTSSIALNIKGIFPFWLILLIVFKLVEFMVTSIILKYKFQNNYFVFDGFGKFVAILIYIFPVFILLLYILKFKIYNFIFYILGFLMLISTSLRFYFCICKICKNKNLKLNKI